MGIAGDIKAYLATRLAGVCSKLRVLVLASLVTIGTAQAQNAATTASRASLSGIQSVITHTRDAVQRRMRPLQLWSQHRQLRATKPDAPDPIAK
jgi:hypothetical protein